MTADIEVVILKSWVKTRKIQCFWTESPISIHPRFFPIKAHLWSELQTFGIFHRETHDLHKKTLAPMKWLTSCESQLRLNEKSDNFSSAIRIEYSLCIIQKRNFFSSFFVYYKHKRNIDRLNFQTYVHVWMNVWYERNSSYVEKLRILMP